jgi:hypothetical protein
LAVRSVGANQISSKTSPLNKLLTLATFTEIIF